LSWESYGEAAKQIIASWAPQLGWPVSLLSQLGRLLPATTSPSRSEIVAEQSSTPDAPQAVAQAAPGMIAVGASPGPAVPSPGQQQLSWPYDPTRASPSSGPTRSTPVSMSLLGGQIPAHEAAEDVGVTDAWKLFAPGNDRIEQQLKLRSDLWHGCKLTRT
jgi:hypothetical protein